MEWALVVQAVAVAEFGPFAPVRIETQPEARLTIVAGMKNGRDAARPFFEQILVLALDHLESADAAADVDARALGRFRIGIDLQPRARNGEVRRRDGELDEPPHLLDFFFFDVSRWVRNS